jgi:Protein of unknown function (DUF3096)
MTGRPELFQIPTLKENAMDLSNAHIQPIVAIIAGILVLLMPRLLNYIVAIALIVWGLIGLNAIHKFIVI